MFKNLRKKTKYNTKGCQPMEFLHNYQKVSFDLSIVNELSKTNPEKLIKDAETLYRKQIDEIAAQIIERGNVKVILLAGPSSSGKTTSSNLLRARLAKAGYDSLVVSMDDFFLNREQTPRLPSGDYDYENVTALDLPYLNQFIGDLFDKGEAQMPLFNFVTGSREKEYKHIKLGDKTIVIMEGIHALNPLVFNKYTENMYKIYICVNTNFSIGEKTVLPAKKIRLMRRLIRDNRTRGMSLEATFNMWQNVLAGEDLFIKPFKNRADYLINSTHAYEPLMYAHHLLPVLKEEKPSPVVNNLIEMLSLCATMPASLLPEDSLLHEFLG